jgi:hypothetical protein
MKKQTTPPVQAHLLRGAFYLLLLLPVCVSPFALAQQNATKPKGSQGRQREQSIGEKNRALPANIIVVTNTNDSGPGSLRDALAVANDGDTIDATGIAGTILLTSGELQITHGVTINGPGAANLAVNGNATFRVFEIFASGVTISGFTITSGLGGISNEDGTTTTVSNCSISGNFDAGISNTSGGLCCATLTVTNSTISDNSADSGGGIINGAFDGGAFLTVTNSTISGNSATANGGGISNGSGGSELAVASVTISNSTLSGNTAAGDGGAIFNSTSEQIAMLVITNSTISDNSATGNGGGISNVGGANFAELDLGNTILDAGSSGENIFNSGTATSLGYNLSSDSGGGVLTGPGDEINTDPLLGPLQDNGGPTFTHALLPGSLAIDTGDPSFTPPPDFDQRGSGFPRVVNGRIDKGSFEVQTGPTPTPTATPTATARPSPTSRPRLTPRPRPTPAPRP